eukprot:2873027-Pyramimonas_sp.AAC.1
MLLGASGNARTSARVRFRARRRVASHAGSQLATLRGRVATLQSRAGRTRRGRVLLSCDWLPYQEYALFPPVIGS